jgi:amino acid transporter
MANKTIEEWNNAWEDAPGWSMLTMYLTLLLIAILSYFGCYFYTWTYWVSAVVGASVPLVMIFLHYLSIKAKTETEGNPAAPLFSILAIIPIVAFAVLGSHAISIHLGLSKQIEQEMICKSLELESAVALYKTASTGLSPSASVSFDSAKYLQITQRLKESYNPLNVGEVLSSARESQKTLTDSFDLLDSALVASSNPAAAHPVFSDYSITKDLESIGSKWSWYQVVIILMLILGAYSPVIFSTPAARD